MAATISILLLFVSVAACLWGLLPATHRGLQRRSLTFTVHKDCAALVSQSDAQLKVQDRGSRISDVAVLKSRPMTVYRPADPAILARAPIPDGVDVRWNRVEVEGPDVEDRLTLLELAKMTGNAYALPGHSNWYDLEDKWNTSFPYGWEDKADGFRGHVFVSSDNTTVVLSIKGTTLQGPTSKKDKFNDNLLFSCCCARVDITWVFATVCNCYSNHWRCDNKCLSKALVEDSLFYSVGVNLVNNLTELYPHANIWLTGHSLGGALAALLGSTFGVPAVTFEAPGELMAARRLHLPVPPLSPITHVFHTADPIPQGACTGFGSACVGAGYAMETKCHLGNKIVYDTVTELGWSVDVRKHTIREVITEVIGLEREWEGDREVPESRPEDEDCIDCYKWEFGDFKKPCKSSDSSPCIAP